MSFRFVQQGTNIQAFKEWIYFFLSEKIMRDTHIERVLLLFIDELWTLEIKIKIWTTFFLEYFWLGKFTITHQVSILEKWINIRSILYFLNRNHLSIFLFFLLDRWNRLFNFFLCFVLLNFWFLRLERRKFFFIGLNFFSFFLFAIFIKLLYFFYQFKGCFSDK